MTGETCSAETTEQAAAESVAPVVTQKRKYTKLAKGDFIRIANACKNVKEVVEKTGMSYVGVRAKLRVLKAGNVALKKCLFEDGRKKK